MGWFDRVRKADAAGRVLRADRRQAMAAFDELAALQGERDRLMRDGLAGSATIVGIHQNVARTTLGTTVPVRVDPSDRSRVLVVTNP